MNWLSHRARDGASRQDYKHRIRLSVFSIRKQHELLSKYHSQCPTPSSHYVLTYSFHHAMTFFLNILHCLLKLFSNMPSRPLLLGWVHSQEEEVVWELLLGWVHSEEEEEEVWELRQRPLSGLDPRIELEQEIKKIELKGWETQEIDARFYRHYVQTMWFPNADVTLNLHKLFFHE